MTQQVITHLEVILGDWQQLPDALLTLNEQWTYINGSIYVIAHANVARALSSEEEALFVQLQSQGAIIAGSSRKQALDTTDNALILPEWAAP